MRLRYIFLILFLFTVIGRIYAYESYNISDEVEYNGHDFYVIENSSADDDTILLLLKDYVSYEELMSLDIENKDQISQYGSFPYGIQGVSYEDSYIKTVVDAWSENLALKPTHIKEARLIKYEDLIDNLGYEENFACTGACYYIGSLDNVPEWFKSNDSSYFTMSNIEDSDDIWMMSLNGHPTARSPLFPCKLRPVVRLYKSALTDIEPEPSGEEQSDVIENDTKNNENSDIVKVPDTLQVISIVFTMIGIVVISISIFMMIIKRKESTK